MLVEKITPSPPQKTPVVFLIYETKLAPPLVYTTDTPQWPF